MESPQLDAFSDLKARKRCFDTWQKMAEVYTKMRFSALSQLRSWPLLCIYYQQEGCLSFQNLSCADCPGATGSHLDVLISSYLATASVVLSVGHSLFECLLFWILTYHFLQEAFPDLSARSDRSPLNFCCTSIALDPFYFPLQSFNSPATVYI